MIAVSVATHATLNSGAKPFFASGCEAGAVFFFEVAQQVLFAQQPGLHAFSLDVLEKMHCRADKFAGDVANATTTSIETMILLSIESSYSTC